MLHHFFSVSDGLGRHIHGGTHKPAIRYLRMKSLAPLSDTDAAGLGFLLMDNSAQPHVMRNAGSSWRIKEPLTGSQCSPEL